MTENRDLIIELCAANDFKTTNVMFRKPVDQTATRREAEETGNMANEQTTTDQHEQLDYTPTARRWKHLSLFL